jgi:hypothetical protein
VILLLSDGKNTVGRDPLRLYTSPAGHPWTAR